MNKIQWIEIIQNKLGGGSATADIKEKYRDGIVRIHCGIAFDDLVVRVFQNSQNSSISDLDSYCKIFPITLLAEVPSGVKYFVMPTVSGRLLQVPNNKAIRRIETQEVDPITPRLCLYREQGMSDVYGGLEVNTYLPNPRYSVLGNKVYFDAKIAPSTAVNVLMIVPFSEWADTDELPAPLENNATIIEEVCQRLLNMPPEDKIIDDNTVQV